MLKYAEIEIDPSTLPEVTRLALMQRGFSHVLGNEVASSVVSLIRKAVAGESGKAGDVTTDQIKAFRAENGDQVFHWETTAENEKLVAMTEGKLGQGKVGTVRQSKDPVAAEAAKITKEEVSAKLRGAGFKVPTGENVLTFPNGDTRTMAQMCETHFSIHGERIGKEASRRAKAKAQVATPPAKKVADAASLGF